ncbi:zinc transporter ZIP1-like protein [Leptotrombidium deliense]|uniref:Zinc transporter ZIP1-like protein n=1 Tax=Leptotrombidium deliense TaxID=299467 RepID=A0A443S8Y5_9ACAR|nr:zinc transporter ZIP1-like protein [Leptotrombidium deliense]
MNKKKTSDDDQQSDRNYPVAELITCGGFFIVYFIEEIAHRFFHKKPHSNQLQSESNNVTASHLHHKSDNNDGHDEDESTKCMLADSNAQTLNYGSLDAVVVSPREKYVNRRSVDSHEESMLNVIIIVIALSFHSLFEGMAIGLQDTVAHVWQLVIAIGIHKLVISFTVGVELVNETKSAKKIIVHLLIFALMTPLGIALAAAARLQVDKLTTGILSAIATGSLLYITFLHILAKEKISSKLPGLLQFLGVLCGFGAMALLQYATEPLDID